MHRHMENPNIGPRDLISCFGIQDTVFQTPCSKISTSHPGIGSGFNPYFSGSERTASKRGCQNYALYKRKVLQPTVSCPKKGWTSASGDRPECSKQVHYKRSFPDGKSKFSIDVEFTRGLYDKYRLKRRIPFSCCSQKFTKVPQFYMGREVLPIQSSPIRPVFGSEDIHETVKTGCCLPKKERHPSAYLSGRFSSPGSNKGRSNQKYSNVSSTPPVPRFHSKPQEILTNSNTNDYLPGFQHRFKVIDNCTSSNKGPEDYGMLPEPDNSTNSHIAKRSKPDRPSGILSASHLAFSPSFSPLADGSDRGPTDESGMLRLTDSPFTGLQERTRLVAGKYSQYKQQPCAPASSRPDNYNRRFEERLGRSAPVIKDQRQMVRTRITPTHQLLGVESSLPSSEVVSQRQISLDRVSKVRQHNSYCVPTIIQPFLQDCQTDLFASRLTTQLKNYISWRPDPEAIHTDALTIHWAPLKGYAFPPFNLISKTLEKVMIDKAEIILVAPVWQAQHWWPVLLKLLISQPVLLPNNQTLLLDPSDPKRVHPMFPRLHLGVFHISTNAFKLRAFRQTLPNYLSQQLVLPHTKPTTQAGTVGAAGVLEGKLIPFIHL